MPAFIRKVFVNADLYHWGNADDWFDLNKFNKKINVILLVDFIDYNVFNQQVKLLADLSDQSFILLTEHHLPDDYFEEYSNIFHFNIPTPETEPLFGPDISHIKDIIDEWRDDGDVLSTANEQKILKYRQQVVSNLPVSESITNLFSIALGNNSEMAHDRHEVYAHLQHRGLLNQCNYTINKLDSFESSNPQLTESYSTIIEHVIPSPIDSDDPSFYRYDHVNNLSVMKSLITSARIYIALDNRPTSPGGLITEKSLYGYLFKRPTIHMGCAENEAILQSYGFKPIKLLTRDISKITDKSSKIIALCNELEHIRQIDSDELSSWISSTQDDIEHNYNMVMHLIPALLSSWAKVKTDINILITQLNEK